MPSTVSSSVTMVLDSSTVITPSLPTFFIASAMMLPIVASLLAEIVPTCAIISPETGLESFFTFRWTVEDQAGRSRGHAHHSSINDGQGVHQSRSCSFGTREPIADVLLVNS